MHPKVMEATFHSSFEFTSASRSQVLFQLNYVAACIMSKMEQGLH